ncbi:hypothetical protein [Paenibacillus sp. MMS18-CY102]|uniref:hypothetical protein n=1 Tax=Paenibacillus sp. MMS18-CY102 TaxID=2682849 RepID=UPI00136526CB|nr:hypothetical protein [Paenibacillus sp. MMS18-CY102]MWC29430.1 hypothetical protein [Paenibacillus sp. MMS18-CY102]
MLQTVAIQAIMLRTFAVQVTALKPLPLQFIQWERLKCRKWALSLYFVQCVRKVTG